MFLATEIPLTSFDVLIAASLSLFITHYNNCSFPFMDYEKARATILILNVLLCSSYPLNFAIYCGMSRYRAKGNRTLFNTLEDPRRAQDNDDYLLK